MAALDKAVRTQIVVGDGQKEDVTQGPLVNKNQLNDVTAFVEDARDQLYKIGLPGKSILGDYLQEKMTSQRPFLLLRFSFPGRPIFIQLPPESSGPTSLTAAGSTTSATSTTSPPL